MPIVYYLCLTLGQAWDLTEILSAFLGISEISAKSPILTHKVSLFLLSDIYLQEDWLLLFRMYLQIWEI